MTKAVNFPYLDLVLEKLGQGNPELEVAFGRHLHWGYWPYPIRNGISSEDFSRAAEALTQKVYRSARVSSGQRVLDVGCGFGGTIASLNENFFEMELVGLNIDPRQLSRAQKKVKACQGNSLYFEAGDACSLPFSDQVFDRVLAVECIFHFSSRERFFKEAHRVLKPDGCLAITDFVPCEIALPFTVLSLIWPFSQGFFGHCNLQYSIGKYRSLAKATGFRVSVEEDITRNTLPTYSFLRMLGRELEVKDPLAVLETWIVERASRAKLLRYKVLSFEKRAVRE